MSGNSGVVCSEVNIPFSWERKPGVPKVTHQEEAAADHQNGWYSTPKLPPPPPPPSGSFNGEFSCQDSRHSFRLPGAAFQHPSAGSVREDPFLMAYKKCTEQPVTGELPDDGNRRGRSKCRRRTMFSTTALSCKNSCSTATDSLVRLSKIPKTNSEEITEVRKKSESEK